MLAKGSGELSGTSMAPKPASTMTAAIESASSGVTPRRMATSGVGQSVKFTGDPRRGRYERVRAPPRDKRLSARDMRRCAWKEPTRLANLRADQEPGQISASVIFREGAHERQRA